VRLEYDYVGGRLLEDARYLDAGGGEKMSRVSKDGKRRRMWTDERKVEGGKRKMNEERPVSGATTPRGLNSGCTVADREEFRPGVEYSSRDEAEMPVRQSHAE